MYIYIYIYIYIFIYKSSTNNLLQPKASVNHSILTVIC